MDGNGLEAAEILLSRRLEEFRRALGSEANGDGGDSLSGGTAWVAIQDLLRSHSRRALKDYVSLLVLFDAFGSEEGIQDTYDRHAERMAAVLLEQVSSGARADRNRAANLVAAVKAEAREVLESETERARSARSAATIDRAGSHELDDRLPLGRRGGFDRDLAEAVERSRREEQSVALVMMDIDHFKKINDTHGHPVGDEVLVDVSRQVVDRLAHKGRAYRYGGEEIALLLPTYSNEEAAGLAERIRKDLETRAHSSRNLRVTASFGVACHPDQASDAKDLVAKADAALYRAKEGGRNQVRTAGEGEAGRGSS